MQPQQIITLMEYLEQQEIPDHPHEIRNIWKAIRSIAQAQGHEPDTWGYIPPSPPPPKTRIIPLPPTVKEMIKHKYSRNKTINKTIQYILFHGSLIGYRPEEIPLVKVEDLYLDQGYYIITEPKKHNQQRQIFPEQELLNHDRRKSFKNLLKLHNQINPDNPYLYIQPNGKPWTVDYLRKWLCKHLYLGGFS